MIDLRLGDCLELMKALPDASVDATIADIPYGTTACSWDTVIPFAPMWEQLKRINKKRAAIVLFGSEPFSSFLRVSAIDLFKYDWIWNKGRATGFVHAKNKPMKAHEIISVFSKGTTVHANQSNDRMNFYPQMRNDNPYLKKIRSINTGNLNHAPSKANIEFVGTINKNDGARYPVSVIDYTLHNVGLDHPTQKPVALMSYLIRTYTNEGDTVLDFTMGSGTTMVACVQTNRNGIGFEKELEHFETAQRRVREAQMQLVLL